VEQNTITDYRLDYIKSDGMTCGMWGLLAPLIVSFALIVLYSILGALTGMTTAQILAIVPIAYITSVVCEASFLVVFYFYNKIHKINWVTASGIKNKTHYLNYAFAIILGLSLPVFFSSLIGWWEKFLTLINYQMTDTLGIPLTNIWYLLMAIIVIGIVPAVCEEFLFRGLILNALRKMGKWPAVLLSALFFSLMHTSMEQLPYTFILGVVIGYVVFETRNIWLGIIIHACNNSFVVIMLYLQQQMGTTVTDTSIWVDLGFTVIYTVVGVGVVMLLVYLMKKLSGSNNKTEISGKIEDNATEISNDSYILVDGKTVPAKEVMDKRAKYMLIATVLIGSLLLIIDLMTSIKF